MSSAKRVGGHCRRGVTCTDYSIPEHHEGDFFGVNMLNKRLMYCFLDLSQNSIVKALLTTFPLPIVVAPSSSVVAALPGTVSSNLLRLSESLIPL